MRGKLMPDTKGFAQKRNIPAYAGKTDWGTATDSPLTEHPRVCGENGATRQSPPRGFGTSPRMRGKPNHSMQAASNSRNIPAYAGKTNLIFFQTHSDPEHPRVCGENAL